MGNRSVWEVIENNTTNLVTTMKIIILGPAWPYRGGIAAFNERLAHQFMQEGHEVELLTFTLQYPSFLFPGTTQYSPDPQPADLHIQRVLNSCNPFNWIRVGRQIAAMQADLLVVAFWLPFMAPALGTVIRVAKRHCKKLKATAILHNLLPHEHRIGDKQFASYFVHALDKSVALSESVCEQVRQFCPDLPQACSPHPLYDNFGKSVSREEAIQHLGLNPEKRYLLFFGLIRDYKGLDWLMEAWRRVLDTCPQADQYQLVVAGEFYSHAEKYQALEKDLHLENKIVWRCEFVPDAEVRYYFAIADMVVQPYKSATQSGVTQIAYHFERPMLVTRVGGLSEIVPDGKVGYSVEPSVEGVAEALGKYIVEKPDFAQGIREEKKKYSWEAMSRCFL